MEAGGGGWGRTNTPLSSCLPDRYAAKAEEQLVWYWWEGPYLLVGIETLLISEWKKIGRGM
jgi:hypothetical protein